MFCSKCGKKTDDSGKYCQWCGAEVKVAPPAPATKLLIKKKSFGICTENYAGFGQRFLAWIIDIIFILVLDIFIMGFTGLNEGVRMIYQFLRGYPMTDR
ncbi:MAG: zinc-ribbon domain-containing protein, partial [Methanomicrobiales archaeon]